MVESCIQEQFACTGCGRNLIRVDVTAPASLPTLIPIYEGMVAGLRGILTVCDLCSRAELAPVVEALLENDD